VLATEPAALLEFFRSLRGSVHVTFEEGTQAQWLYDLLVPLVHQVLVCDRRGEKRRGNKGDHEDADALSDLLRCGRLRATYHASRSRATLKELARGYTTIVADSTRVMGRLKALFRARAIKTRGGDVFASDSETRQTWLAKLSEPGARFRAKALYMELTVLETVRLKTRVAMVTEAKRDPAWRVLRSIPFIGPVRAALLLATLQTPGAFGRSGIYGAMRGWRWSPRRRRST